MSLNDLYTMVYTAKKLCRSLPNDILDVEKVFYKKFSILQSETEGNDVSEKNLIKIESTY